jgi:diguanylate cyclase (GGDEF)-like protein
MSGTAPERILVVEDSGTVRRLIVRILTRAGFVVTEAADGLEAVLRCALDRPDVVVLDIEMPRCGGIAALEQIKADPGLADTEVLVLTSRQDPADARAALAAGASDYVRKPCDPGEIVQRVRRLADARLVRQELRDRSSTDELTGLPNRRGVEALLRALTVPESAFVGLALVDIDWFKAVNDRWGHATGDVVLRAVAERLSRAWPVFTVARWGGEEFLAIGPVQDTADLAGIAERFRMAVSGGPIEAGAAQLSVTVSVGAAMVPRGEPIDVALEAADAALYTAKRQGRDRVVVSGGSNALVGGAGLS